MITKDDFLFRDDIFFFNNGSYGACPKVVFEKYQQWQRVLEYQPIEYFQKTLIPELKKVREKVGKFIHADAEDLVITTNATFATNTIVRSLDLSETDEVLVTNHEYGACLNAWGFWQKEKGFKIKVVDLELPLPSTDAILELFKAAVNKHTKVIFFSHITSKTAQILPAEEICRFAAENNILTVIDGAHTIGQLELNVQKIKPDFYYSNIHKWCYAPKASAFLYTCKKLQPAVKPLVAGWGWGTYRELPSGSEYVDANQFYGTNDFAPFLAVADAIDFYLNNNVKTLKIECNKLVKYFLTEADKLTGKQSLYVEHPSSLMLGVIEVPKKYPALDLKNILYNEYKIEVPVIEWEGKLMLRISIQIFNTKAEVDQFLNAIRALF